MHQVCFYQVSDRIIRMSVEASSASYTISQKDFIAASRLHETPPLRLVLILVAVLIGLVVVYITDYYGFGQLALGTLAGLILAYVVLQLFASPYKAKRFYQRFDVLHAPLRIKLLPTGLELHTSGGIKNLAWKGITDWKQNQQFLLIYPNPNVFYIIPKAIYAEGFDGRALEQALSLYVGKAS